MKQRILNELKSLKRRYPDIEHKFKVCFDLDSYDTYGEYHPNSNVLFFNMVAANFFGFEKFREIVIHEFAHYIAVIKYKNMNHNKIWKKIMFDCGIFNAKAKSDLGTFPYKGLVPVSCKCSTHYIKRNELFRFKSGRVKCKKCLSLVN